MSSDSPGAIDPVPSMPLPDCGQRISVETPRHSEKLWTHMVGYKPAAYLVLEKPPGTEALGALKDGDMLVIRFMKDGSVFGFRTPILGTLSMPYKLLFVAYPGEVARHSLRASPRLQCFLPCDGEVGGRAFTRAFIRDFSATGCQLRVPLDALEEEVAPRAESAAETAVVSSDSAAGAERATSTARGEQGAAAAAVGSSDAEAAPPSMGRERLALNMHLPGATSSFRAEGEVLEWQQQPRYHVLRVKFDQAQTELFELLSLYMT